jgi:hypothetical protein
MRNVLKSSAPLLAGAFAALALAVPAAAQFGPPPPGGYPDQVNHNPIIYADLGPAWQFTGVIDPKTDQLCYMINTPGVDQPTAAHIHVGKAGQDGAPVVPLVAPKDGASGACVALKPDLEQKLLADPDGYYVNIHTAADPAGAARGQLKGYDPDKV